MTQTETTEKTLSMEIADAVATVTISNPPLNVINIAMAKELDAIIDTIEADDSIRVVRFRSAQDGVFVAGADITVLADIDAATIEEMKQYGTTMDRLARLRQPTIAAMAGTALGGGFELALACDFRFLAEGFGEVGLPEVRLALLPGWGGTQRLPRLVGAGVATEMLLKGMRYTPDKALELGLVHKVVPAAELEEFTAKYALSLAKQAPLAVQTIKACIRASFEMPGDDGLEFERAGFAKLLASNDAKEGLGAFLEARKPDFTGT